MKRVIDFVRFFFTKVFDKIVITFVLFMLICSFLLDTSYSMKCDFIDCKVYEQGRFEEKATIKYTIKHSDIKQVYVDAHSHTQTDRVGQKRIHHAHTDYVPVVVLNNGDTIRLPFSHCRSSEKAEHIVRGIQRQDDFIYTAP